MQARNSAPRAHHNLSYRRSFFAIVLTFLFLINVSIAKQHAGHEMHPGHNPDTLNVALHTEPQIIEAGVSTILTFHLTDAKGEAVTELLVHHARVLHVLVISENLQTIGHIHPEDFDTRDIMTELEGMYTVHFTFPTAGRYILAIDIMNKTAEVSKHMYVNVTGEPKMAPRALDMRSEKSVPSYTDEGGERYTKAVSLNQSGDATYHVKMKAPEQIKAGELVTIRYHFSRDGKPLTELTPFLDAPMHFAIVDSELTGILHTHGTVPSEQHTGHKMQKKQPVSQNQQSPGGHHHQAGTPDKFGPEVNLMTTFPEAGIYQIFGQLKHTDQIIWLGFMVRVE